jgi:nucleoside-diphosphate-sugar epimerase
MKLAITGAAGFLGYHLCNGLSSRFEEIIGIDIAPFERSEYPKNVHFVNADVRDERGLRDALKDCDMVVHGAAALPLWKKEDIYTTNVQGTRNVLEAAIAHGIERVVFVSSTAVYGVPKKHPIYEIDPLVGVGPYGETKIEAEELCVEYRKRGLCVPIIRPKTFIGTGRLGVFQILYDWVHSGKRTPIIGNGRNRYQLLEVEDLVSAIYLLLTLPEQKVNDVFNVGAKEFMTVYEDVNALCEYSGTGARVIPIPSAVAKPILTLLWMLHLSPLYRWVYGTADTDSFVSIDKAEQMLGWSPRFSNKDALIRSYQWYVRHMNELSASGITHRVAWKQGILSIVKKCM